MFMNSNKKFLIQEKTCLLQNIRAYATAHCEKNI